MRLISYNLRNHSAVSDLESIVAIHDPDALCIQEAHTALLPRSIADLRLVQATAQNRLGLAMYLRPERFRTRDLRVVALRKSLHDRLMKPAHERLIAVRAFDAKYEQEVVLASFHAAPLTALNSLRRHQITTAFSEMHDLGEGLPALMAGDYNYPFFQRSLADRLRTQGYTLSKSDRSTYSRYRVLRGHYDFATSKGFEVEDVRTLPQSKSDHLPILVQASLAPVAANAEPVLVGPAAQPIPMV